MVGNARSVPATDGTAVTDGTDATAYDVDACKNTANDAAVGDGTNAAFVEDAATTTAFDDAAVGDDADGSRIKDATMDAAGDGAGIGDGSNGAGDGAVRGAIENAKTAASDTPAVGKVANIVAGIGNAGHRPCDGPAGCDGDVVAIPRDAVIRVVADGRIASADGQAACDGPFRNENGDGCRASTQCKRGSSDQ